MLFIAVNLPFFRYPAITGLFTELHASSLPPVGTSLGRIGLSRLRLYYLRIGLGLHWLRLGLWLGLRLHRARCYDAV